VNQRKKTYNSREIRDSKGAFVIHSVPFRLRVQQQPFHAGVLQGFRPRSRLLGFLLLAVALGTSASAWAQLSPNELIVDVPAGTNNSAGAGSKTCTIPGSCTGGLSTGAATDDVFMTSITFGTTTFTAASGQIIPGLASVFLDGGGGSNVNAEWGDNDNSNDGNDNPFNKAGWPIPPNIQETTNLDIIDDTLLVVFRSFNLNEGIDGEDNNSTINLDFVRAVNDNDGSTLDTVPEIIIFERGLNSDVNVQLVLADGGLSNTLFVPRADFVDTGFNIDTVEITGAGGQALGVVGLDLNAFSGTGFDPATDTVVGLRFGSAGNGADIFGVFGTSTNPVILRDYGDAPDSYGTLTAANGPRHVLNNRIYIGTTPDLDDDGEPSAQADAAIDEDPTDSITLPNPPTPLGPGDTYSVTVAVTNLTGSDALLCGWIDFNDDGSFANTDGSVGATNAERACATVADGSISTGSTPTEVTLDFILPNDIVEQPPGDEFFISRFRITTDWTSSAGASPQGDASDGEVEDHRISSAGTLPVSVIGFESEMNGDGLVLRWTTASETHNAGFHIWADYGRGLERLTERAIPSQSGDAATSRQYETVLEGIEGAGIRSLALSAIDFRGKEEFYGRFSPDRSFGTGQTVAEIDWPSIRRDATARADARPSRTDEEIAAVSVRFDASGMAEVTASDLAAAGLNLEGVPVDRIAVSLKDAGIAREATNPVIDDQGVVRFGPQSGLRFWVRTPEFPDALYLDHYRYRISEDPARVVAARVAVTGVSLFSDRFQGSLAPQSTALDYWASLRYAEDRSYHFSSPLDDPWSAATLRADAGNVHSIQFDLGAKALVDQAARLRLSLGGLTSFPAAPDHHVAARVNGVEIGELFFDGASVQDWVVDIPAGTLARGSNTIEVIAAGGTAAPFDLFLLDEAQLDYRRELQAVDGVLDFADDMARLMRARGFGGSVSGYAWQDGVLARLQIERSANGSVIWHTLEGRADYWVANADRLLRPISAAPHRSESLINDTSQDFLLIAHPAFLPLDGETDHPLTRFMQARRLDGWTPGLYDIGEIQTRYGWGMPLPEALTRFLIDADSQLDYEHVLLVGSDSYDYRDILGLGSISFIPTRYAGTQFIPHTPSDALLADLDGDGLSDKAIGRWPVRSLWDLESIVQKTLDWTQVQDLASTVWVTDSQDPRQSSFTDQAERMLEPLMAARWPFENMERIHFDEVVPAPGLSVAETARARLFEQIEQGRTLTGFVGHGSPSVWTFQGLLSPNDLADLNNEGLPTLITTMTCYTSYFVSPRSDTVAHRWMNGYGVDDFGNPIAGRANGAVGVHGASTLSSYLFNERFARDVVSHQLDGKTLGQAIEAARRRAQLRGMDDQVINWTLLGDPTLRMN